MASSSDNGEDSSFQKAMKQVRQFIMVTGTVAALSGLIASCSSEDNAEETNKPKEENYGKFGDRDVKIFLKSADIL